ncbi:CoA transferase [Frigidibacter albus]|uniref:CoA transferase n=1 Tax=Frigidibacter albus TaxID=1465486 RepID=A0A6L8VL53_9RHOB|nr:CoA transferase [Frigidibacter albus]MZQ91095.1 CoA transferase [Frigidibacter albus]NBE32980.1 CoA transferase [Frigidibacter albus]GGH62761.1 CoA transferase [Frigidibacter albus]
MTQILKNIRVLDLSRIVAAPFATQTLGDMGAEVIKIERPGPGDDSRQYGPPFAPSASGGTLPETPLYMANNRNKKSMAVNLSTPEGQAIIRELAVVSDVLVENFKTGDLARYGLDYESLRRVNPRLIYCSVTGFGQTGPYKDKPAVDSLFQAMSGMMSITGEPDGLPTRTGFSIGDILASSSVLSSILGALYHRDINGGAGQHIDISCLDATIAALSHRVMQYFMTGVAPVRMGAATPNTIPSQPFDCADVPLIVSAGTDRLYRKFCIALERPDLADDPRFVDVRGRAANRGELLPELERIMKTRTAREWMTRLDAAGIVTGPIYDLQNTFEDPQVIERGLRIDLPHEGFGNLSFLRNPIRYSETDLDSYTAPPAIGQHTDDVLREVLGRSADDIAALRGAGTVA